MIFRRLRRLWELSKYEVGTTHVTTEDGTQYKIPALRNIEAKPRGAATIVDMQDTLEKDFPTE